jgi:hypothetical protein
MKMLFDNLLFIFTQAIPSMQMECENEWMENISQSKFML